jgi:MFS family permease
MPLDRSVRNVVLLALCLALAMTGNALVMTVSALTGHMLAADKALATLPLGLQFTATMAATIPASLLMKRIGRRAGFTVGALIGAAGGLVSCYAIFAGSFPLFCLGAAVYGVSVGFAFYYRFAAADTASDAFRSRAISFVMAGGVAAAIFGPTLAEWSHDCFAPALFAGSYAAIVGLTLVPLALLQFVEIPLPSVEERTRSGRPLGEIMRQPVFLVAVGGARRDGRLRGDVAGDDRDAAGHARLPVRVQRHRVRDPVARARHVRAELRHRTPDSAFRRAQHHADRRRAVRRLRTDQPQRRRLRAVLGRAGAAGCRLELPVLF